MNLCVFFSVNCFNMCIVHGYIPNSCLNTTTVPICKNKNGNMSDTSNYRPVAVGTVVSKLLEHFVLINIFLSFPWYHRNQFGFKAGHSTDQCTFLLKQAASYFVTHGSSVHAVFTCLVQLGAAKREVGEEIFFLKNFGFSEKTLFSFKELVKPLNQPLAITCRMMAPDIQWIQKNVEFRVFSDKQKTATCAFEILSDVTKDIMVASHCQKKKFYSKQNLFFERYF